MLVMAVPAAGKPGKVEGRSELSAEEVNMVALLITAISNPFIPVPAVPLKLRLLHCSPPGAVYPPVARSMALSTSPLALVPRVTPFVEATRLVPCNAIVGANSVNGSYVGRA
jgi:hypothetical protein